MEANSAYNKSDGARELRQWCIEQALKWPVGEPQSDGMDYGNVIDRASKVEEYVLNGKPQAERERT